MFNQVSSRKLLVSLVILVSGIAISAVKGDIPHGLLQLMEVIFGGFIVGNVGEHIVNGSVMKKAGVTRAAVGLQAIAQPAASPAAQPSVALPVEAPPPVATELSGDTWERLDRLESRLAAQEPVLANMQNALIMLVQAAKGGR